mmetsp:Transcript_58471/g.137663  ORF Transcript_58471/g.137663 Transcript_58471/m.137663 type:complete len:204 (+) Transcript_58471:190-801(+)
MRARETKRRARARRRAQRERRERRTKERAGARPRKRRRRRDASERKRRRRRKRRPHAPQHSTSQSLEWRRPKRRKAARWVTALVTRPACTVTRTRSKGVTRRRGVPTTTMTTRMTMMMTMMMALDGCSQTSSKCAPSPAFPRCLGLTFAGRLQRRGGGVGRSARAPAAPQCTFPPSFPHPRRRLRPPPARAVLPPGTLPGPGH